MSKRKKYNAFMIFSVIFSIIYFLWRIFFTMPTAYGIVAMICAIIFLVCEVIASMELFINVTTSMDTYIPEMPQIPKDWYPDVDVFIATHNESTDILYKTINGCKHMKYPDKSKVHIWICDDGNRAEMRELAEKMNVGYQGLANNKLAKAGNLNNALSKTSSPLIVTFDSDMIPTRDFLMETVPYFFMPKMKKNKDGVWVERKLHEIDSKYKIGFIQTPQSFYNPDLFQYNLYSEHRIPNEQDYFFKEINVNRNSSNSPIYAGSNTVISRKALEEVGGIVTGTITEDFETGLRIQEEGYSCFALNKVLAHGLSPETIDSLIKQRERWGRGCIFSLRRISIFKNKNISWRAKLSYFSCELYWWTFLRRFVFIIAPILFSLFSVPVLVCRPWQLLTIWLPYYYVMNKSKKIAASGIRNQHWSDVIDTVMFPYLIIPIVMEALGIKKRKFVVTKKDRTLQEKSTTIYAIPHILLLIFSVFTLFVSSSDLIKYQAFGSIIIIYWIVVNIISLIMAIFFMTGRNNYRMTERYDAEIPVSITADNHAIEGKTVNISEGGLAVILDKPVFIKNKEDIKIIAETEDYKSEFSAKVVYVQKLENEMKWKYSFQITDIDDLNKDEYYQIVYDREPSLSDKIEENISIFDDLFINIAGRNHLNVIHNEFRKAYRIPINEELKTSDGNSVYVFDFNYSHILLKAEGTMKERINIAFEDGIELKCILKKYIQNGEKALYEVKDLDGQAVNAKLKAIIKRWLINNSPKEIE